MLTELHTSICPHASITSKNVRVAEAWLTFSRSMGSGRGRAMGGGPRCIVGHLDHAGGVAEGEEGEASVGAAEGDPAAEPDPAPGVARPELAAESVPLGPLQRLHPLQLRLGLWEHRRLLGRCCHVGGGR